MRWVLLVAAVALGGCPGPGDPTPDAAPPVDVGVRLGWSTAHPNKIPGPAKAGITITAVTLNLSSVRIISDLGNDPRTTLSELQLAWRENVEPVANAFVDAPPGIYSRVGFELEADDGDEFAYEIRGTARIETLDVPFRIVDGGDLDISVSHKRATLSPGEMVDMGIRLDFEKVFDQVDFEELPLLEGVRVLDESSDQIDEVRKAIHDELFRGADGDDGPGDDGID